MIMTINADLAKSLFPENLLKQLGDMAIQNLEPQDNNRGGRIIKNMRICGSGIYRYHISEAPLLGLVIDDMHGDCEWIDVYRPPEVLEANKQLYARIPIITGHHVLVNTENAKQLAVGMVGDTVLSEVGDDGETYLYTTGTIIAGDGIEAYEKYGELSVGYDPIIKWQDGEHNGKKYNAVMTGLAGVNHLLICKTARGGHQCMVMDSLDDFKHYTQSLAGDENNGGKQMDFFKKIFGSAKKTETINGDAKVASAMLQSIKVGADCKTQVEAVQKMLGDNITPELKGYFEELTGDAVTKADKETVAKAIDIVDAAVQKVFGDSCSEQPETKAGDEEKKPDEEKKHGVEGDEDPNKKTEEEIKHPSNGDEAITKADIEKMIGDAVSKALAKAEPEQKKEEPEMNGDEVSRLDALIAGDSKDGNKVSSDNLMKEIWG